MSSRSSDLNTSVRLRGFNKTNLWAWVVSIDNDSYTSCSFKNCKFMAFDVEDMYHHYSLCNSSYTANHICSICMKGTDTESLLFKHKILQHTNEVTFADFCFFDKNEDTLTPCSRTGRVPSKVVKRSWEVSLQKRQYIKCLVPTCYFVTSDIDEMAAHYEYYCTPLYRKSLTFTCPICRGRCERPDDLKKHIERNHNNVKKVNKVPQGMSNYWRAVLGRYGWARCCSPGCYFIDSDINVLQEHYIYCKDPTRGKLLECEGCHGWLCGLNKLLWHVRDIHDPSCARPDTYMKLTNWREQLSEDTPPSPKATTPRPLPHVLVEDDSNSGELVIVEKEDNNEPDNCVVSESPSQPSPNSQLEKPREYGLKISAVCPLNSPLPTTAGVFGFEAFTKKLEEKFRILRSDQRLLAEKLINDVLSSAERCELSSQSKLSLFHGQYRDDQNSDFMLSKRSKLS